VKELRREAPCSTKNVLTRRDTQGRFQFSSYSAASRLGRYKTRQQEGGILKAGSSSAVTQQLQDSADTRLGNK
jgi:hypothetical protein